MRQFGIFLFFIAFSSVNAQNGSDLQKSDDRYEIVQSSITARITIKLDRRTGETFLLTKGNNDEYFWDKIPRLDYPDFMNEKKGDDQYRIFTSTTVVRNVILINIVNGATWILTSMKDDSYLWQPIHEKK